MELIHSGKVREIYADGSDVLLVASDRISVYDVVLPTPIPDKGAVLTQLSLWWFDRLPEPIFTPSTKAPLGQHDEPTTFGEVEDASRVWTGP